jgi:hypothetical protein
MDLRSQLPAVEFANAVHEFSAERRHLADAAFARACAAVLAPGITVATPSCCVTQAKAACAGLASKGSLASAGPVVAPSSGTVISARNEPAYGKIVILRHPGNIRTAKDTRRCEPIAQVRCWLGAGMDPANQLADRRSATCSRAHVVKVARSLRQ